ncbi:MAG: glycosyltransferase [Candidatus Pacebacteria bacterium]|nr:glycosyltransferase [Candidatus Paceibacterota bacterium]
MGKFLKDTIFTFAANIAGFFLTLVSSVIVARALDPEGKGIYAMAALFASLLATFANPGIGSAAIYNIGRKKYLPAQALGNTVILSFLVSLLALAAGAAAVVLFGGRLFPNIGPEYLSYVAVFFLLWVWSKRAAGGFSFAFNGSYARDMLVYGGKIYLGSLFSFLRQRNDVFLINFFLSPAAVGLYSVARGISEKIWLIAQSTGLVLFPRVACETDPEKLKRITPLVSRNVLFLSVVAAAGIYIFSHFIVLFLYSTAFLGAVSPLNISLIGIVATSGLIALGNDFAGRGKPMINAYINILSLVTSVVLSLVLIPRFGVDGAAWSFSISCLVLFSVMVAVYCRISGNRVFEVIFVQKSDLEYYRRAISLLTQRMGGRSAQPAFKDMKIIYTSPSIDPVLEKRHFAQIAKNLMALGDDLLLLVPRHEVARGAKAGGKFSLRTVEIPVKPGSFKSYLYAELMRFLYLPYLLVKFRPDAVYNRKERFDLAVPLWCWIFGVPYVVEVNGMIDDELRLAGYPGWLLAVFGFSERVNYRLAAQVICVTAGIKDRLVKRFKLREDTVRVISNGTDTGIYRPLDKQACRRGIGLAEGFFYVGFAGSIGLWQDLETLVEAAARLKSRGIGSVRYLLVGGGECRASLEKLVKDLRLGKEFIFRDWVDYEELPQYLNSFDIGYISRSKLDLGYGFSPLKLYDYLACGLPVLAGGVRGIAEPIEESGCGFVFRAGDAQSLASRIEDIFAREKDLEAMGRAGRRLACERYSWERAARETRDCLRRAAEEFHKKR